MIRGDPTLSQRQATQADMDFLALSDTGRECCAAWPYLLALAAQSVVCLQFDVHPSVGGLSGALASGIKAIPSPAWQAAHIALALLGVALYALRATRRMLFAWLVIAAIAAISALVARVETDDLLENSGIVAFFIAPATGVMLFNRIRVPARAIGVIAVGVAVTFVVVGCVAARTLGGSFTDEERIYVKQVFAANRYGCSEFLTHPPAKDSRDYLSRVIDMEDLGAEGYLMRAQISNWLRVPIRSALIYLSEGVQLRRLEPDGERTHRV